MASGTNPAAPVTLVADTDTTINLDGNYAAVEVALISGAATTVFNTTGTVINSSAPSAGNHTLTTALVAKVVPDGTGGANSVVHVRSAGTPTVQVFGL